MFLKHACDNDVPYLCPSVDVLLRPGGLLAMLPLPAAHQGVALDPAHVHPGPLPHHTRRLYDARPAAAEYHGTKRRIYFFRSSKIDVILTKA